MGHRFHGKTVLVTGGSRGIGRACAIAFAKEGASVAINYVKNKEEANTTISSVRALGARGEIFQGDASISGNVNDVVGQVVADFGRIDILVNNAGVLRRTPFLEIPEAEWDWVIDTNLKGYFLVGQAVARHMVAQSIKGAMVNISSNAQDVAGLNVSHYAISKAGVAMLTKCMALELAQYGIRVNAVAPGLIETDMNKKDLASPEYRAKRISGIPLRQIGTAEDVVGAVTYLASDDARLATGHALFLDAGANIF